MTRLPTLLLLLGVVLGCSPPVEAPLTESKPLISLYAPDKAQVGRPFPIYAEVDGACGSFQSITATEDAGTKAFQVTVTFKPPPMGVSCDDAILRRRYSTKVTPREIGTYTVSGKGYSETIIKTVQLVAEPVSEWTPPTFVSDTDDPGN